MTMLFFLEGMVVGVIFGFVLLALVAGGGK